MNKITVALCTYNGERYLNNQLGSILSQTRHPDQIVVCDDGSSDRTMEIMLDFSAKAPFPVSVYSNDQNLGPTRNFDKAISIADGDLIALSDQDDVWSPTKLEKCEELLNKNPTAGAVFCNAEVTDQNLAPLGYDIWHRSGFKRREQQRAQNEGIFPTLLKHYLVTGSTLMFRADFKQLISPIPEYWFHDAWIALLISAVAPISMIPEPMMKYRQHSSNHLGGMRKGMIREIIDAFKINRTEYYKYELERYRSAYARIVLSNHDGKTPSLSLLEQKIRHLEYRASMPKNRMLRIPAILRELFLLRYNKYARNWGSMAMDLFFK